MYISISGHFSPNINGPIYEYIPEKSPESTATPPNAAGTRLCLCLCGSFLLDRSMNSVRHKGHDGFCGGC